MDRWDNNSIDYRRHPSFSSTLLDHIYRSTDDSSDVSMRNKQSPASLSLDEHRLCLDKILVNRRKTADDFVRSRNPNTVEPLFFNHSTSTSSSSSDSFYRRRTRSSPPKPTRTTVEKGPKNSKVKSKALKMYSDLKKVKHPISPGGRLATFINSLFTGNAKKTNKTVSTATSSTTCSSASSFSRSCLSNKTTSLSSSSEKSKRSVRFCPVNEDSKRMEEENRRVIEAAKELLRTYRKNKDVVNISAVDDDEDDDASCASSDLFELDNLSVIGIDRYREELPVYETTRFNTKSYRIIST